MKIAFDAIPTIGQKSGIGNYAYNLLKNLVKIDKYNQYILYAFFWKKYFERIKTAYLPNGENFSLKTARIPEKLLNLLWDYKIIPSETIIGNFDIIHSTSYRIPYSKKGKVIVTIYDLSFLKFNRLQSPEYLRFLKRQMMLVSKRVDAIITISENTKSDIINLLKVNPEIISVIELGVNDKIDMKPKNDSKSFIRKKFSIKDDYILYVGNIEPRKNIDNLFKAYKILKAKSVECKLVITGALGWLEDRVFKTLNEVGIRGDVIFTGYVLDEDLPFLYSAADLFVYPSIYEGFGLPVLEAMKCGVPVVTSKSSSLIEVSGDAAILIDTHNPEEIAETIYKVLNDESLREDMKNKGIERAKQFSWENTAKKTLKLYKQVYG